ncbi:MAG: GDSL-type esterase/lipase family protein [Candidatus Eiseniibacteriota bacterium]
MRLCVFGDSFTNGTGDPERLGWLGRASAGARDVTVYNLGVRGDTSADIRARWRDEAERRLAGQDDARLIFAFGVNDCCDDDKGERRVARDATLANTTAILSEASARWPVLMIGPPPIADAAINTRIEDLNGAFGETAARGAVPYGDVFGALRADATWMRDVAAWDGAHPGAEGYQVLAGLIVAWPAWRAWFPAR